MKKLHFLLRVIFLLILLSMQIFPQINPNEFSKIGFADMYWLYKYPVYYGGYNSGQFNYSSQSYYFPQLVNLGLTDVVTDADAIPLNPAYNSSIKILDNNFYHTSYKNPYMYAQGVGNYTNHLAYEVGGNNISLINNNGENFGFGTNNTSNPYCSWWIQPFDVNTIGNPAYVDPSVTPNVVVHKAIVGTDNPGVILHAEFDPTHQPYDSKGGFTFEYRVYIDAKIDGSLGTDNVAQVTIYEKTGGSSPNISNHLSVYSPKQSQANSLAGTQLTNFSYYITANDFGGNQYVTLASPQFRKTGGRNTILVVEINWLRTRNLYIDKIAVANQYYDDLFISNNPSSITAINNDLSSAFSSVSGNSLYAHLYNDEPYPLMYRAVGKVSSLAEQDLGSGKYVNGATMGLPIDMILIANNERRVPYVLYDDYTIKWGTDTASSGSNSIQNAYDNLINYDMGSPGYGVERYSGMKQAIQWAQNFTPNDPSDDFPFYNTLQVGADHNIQSGAIISYEHRAPTYYEILAEGNLSICYGAKGIMFYPIMTNTPSSTDPYNEYSVYGLFDQQGKAYSDAGGTVTNFIQDPAQPQVPNTRFYAVQSLNQYIDKIKSTLLQLTWTNGFSIYKGQPAGTYITQVSTSDQPSNTYVELGTFKESDQMSNNNLDYFFIINRRTLSTEQRNISITINKSTTIFSNWKITEVGTSNTWTVSNTGTFTTSYQPGEGKLFRLEPVMIAGGNLVYNETIPANNSVTLNAGNTYTLSSNVSITVNGTLNASGTSTNPIIFNNGSIIFSGSGASSSILNYVDINNGPGIQCLNTGGITIEYSKLSYCTNGIYIYNSYPSIEYNQIIEPQQNGIYGQSSTSLTILNNTITKTSASGGYYHNYQGLYFYSNTPVYANYNDESGFYWGAYIGGGSNATFHDWSFSNPHPYNRFRDNLYGIGCAWGSTINMTWAKYGGSGNSIYNNSNLDIDCYQSSTAYAQNTYWGGGEPKQSVDGSSYLIVDPVLTSDPWNGGGAQPVASPSSSSSPTLALTTTSTATNSSPVQPLSGDDLSDMNLGLQLENGNQISQAIIHYQSLISSGRLVNFSLTELKNIRGRNPGYNIEAYFQALTKNPKYAELANKLMGDCYLQDGKFDDAINAYNNVIQNYPKDYEANDSRFGELFAYLNIKKDVTNATLILTGLKQGNIQDEELKMRLAVAENLFAAATSNLNKVSNQFQKESKSVEKTDPLKYSMEQNYPNPFNPTTVIGYQIPNNNYVTLKVYDVLGNLVKTLVDGYRNEGSYSVNFNASNLPSGIYFYQLKAGSFTATKKLLLLK